jgi:large conductance mechanosensitive channel
MSFLQEFKEFASRGNMVDLAIGVVIGTAFGKITSSLVNDVIMPPIGLLLGGMDFSSLAFTLKAASGKTPAVVISYGAFINTLVDFLIIAFCMFLVVKAMNRMMPKEPEKQTTVECPECLMPIPVDAKKCGHCTSDISRAFKIK